MGENAPDAGCIVGGADIGIGEHWDASVGGQPAGFVVRYFIKDNGGK